MATKKTTGAKAPKATEKQVEQSVPATENKGTQYRIPFIMHLSGFKYREIAEKLGLPLGTVKSRIFFTRQHLQMLLKDFR